MTPSGVVYERKLVEQAIRETEEGSGKWTCVITGSPVSISDLIVIRTALSHTGDSSGSDPTGLSRVVPRSAEMTSIPGILNLLRSVRVPSHIIVPFITHSSQETHVHVHPSRHTHTHIEREREREREAVPRVLLLYLSANNVWIASCETRSGRDASYRTHDSDVHALPFSLLYDLCACAGAFTGI